MHRTHINIPLSYELRIELLKIFFKIEISSTASKNKRKLNDTPVLNSKKKSKELLLMLEQNGK
jgi:hypothetical protein